MNHEGHEDHEATIHRPFSMRLPSPLAEGAEHAISYESEKAITVSYRGTQIEGQRVDLIVEGLIVVELKAVARFDDVHQAQVMSYLRTTGLRGGLLINFRVPVLKAGLKRIV